MRSAIQILSVFLTFFGAAGLAHAEEAAERTYENNVIEALHYRSPARSIYSSFSLVTPVIRTEDDYAGTGKSFHFSRTALNSNLNLTYGVTDQLSVGLTESYLVNYKSTRTDTTTGATSSFSMSGISDPTIDLSYRCHGGLTGKRFESVYFNVTPAVLGKEKNASATADGNNYAADSEIAIGSNYYFVEGTSEFMVNPFLRYFTAGTYTNQDNSTYTNDGYYVYGVSGTYRRHLSDKFYLSTNVTILGPNDETFNETGVVLSESFSTQVSETVTVGYKSNEAMLFALGLSNSTYSNLITRNDGGNASTDNVQTNNVTLTAVRTF